MVFQTQAQNKAIVQNAPLKDFLYVSSGTLYLSATDSIRAELKFNVLTPTAVWAYRNGKQEEFDAVKIKGFKLDTLGGILFEKIVRSYIIEEKPSFYQNLFPESKKELKLYRIFNKESSAGTVTGEWQYYLFLSNRNEIRSVNDVVVLPYHKKLVPYLKGCPELAGKVENKVEGYTFKLFTTTSGVSNQARKDHPSIAVISRIMEEYNACK
jgi:hypothetical protein